MKAKNFQLPYTAVIQYYYHSNCTKLIVRLEHSISLLYSKELLYFLNKTDIAAFVIQLYLIFSKTQQTKFVASKSTKF